ncbi:hypothetical protein [Cellulomonas sp. PhB150]|uniref:hypothetical protein n=1 Tax=Cellulomonas sp. PhB150 TaxID=2485188 RepID=UPI000FB4F659|nr:hypothetical protein [Cellulomonas sp. PhB150]ROS22959.1 hypothetical protein EDF34_3132 [Cellulomonas sp. PhB150]
MLKNRVPVGTAFAVSVSILALTACSSSEVKVDAAQPYFEGLEAAYVQEVLDNPVSRQKINEEPEDTRASMAQGIVRNFIVCRGVWDDYSKWITTGVRPDLVALPEPKNPEEPSATQWKTDYAYLESQYASGEPDQVRDWLTQPGSCGAWIPVSPDKPDVTISDAVRAGS